MRKLLQWLFRKPIAWIAAKLSSAPKRDKVFESLNGLLADISQNKRNRGPLRNFELDHGKFIVFSDQHKGTRDEADDFGPCESNYLAALEYYNQQDFYFISLGDCEELWKFTPADVMKKNTVCFEAEKKFLDKNNYFRSFGNHDLIWKFMLQLNIFLRPVFGKKIRAYEGLLLHTTFKNEIFSIFFAHGHQGDQRSDGNAFSTWVVANIWTPIQRYLHISINTPATSFDLTDKHNIIMYDWSATKERMIFISGHTHKPVFASLDHIERMTRQLEKARADKNEALIASIEAELKKRELEYAGKQQVRTMARPSYFNSGCCCFDDGDITGIEIADGFIRLVKWDNKQGPSTRIVLEEVSLGYVFDKLMSNQMIEAGQVWNVSHW